MKPFIFHLRKLVRINRQILSELHQDEASIASMREAFDKRALHTREMGELVPEIDKELLSDKESATIQTLFEKFGQQAIKIQAALDEIVENSGEKLGDAVKRRKAEEGYQSLK